MKTDLNAVVLAAGEGSRLGAGHPKVLTPLWGQPSVVWTVDAALSMGLRRLVVVGGEHLPAIEAALAGRDGPIAFAHQERPDGTGSAVLAAEDALKGEDPALQGTLLILYGDCPLLRPSTLADLLAAHEEQGAELTVLTTRLADPHGYGRAVRDADGSLAAIVEQADADAATAAIDEVNTGVWAVSLPGALEDLRSVGSDNAQGETYLTDLVALARSRDRRVAAVVCEDAEETLGFNDHRELATVRAVLRRRILDAHLEAGVEIVDPDSTFIDAQVSIEAGARILPSTVIEGAVRIGAGCEVGPFTHLREGTVLEPGAEVGNFTETKKTTLGQGSKAKHLSYLGDATIGAGSNIGAGTITANYDGKAKHPTRIGAGAFIGSGTVLVAPVNVGPKATTGAGAIVTRNSDVGEAEVWVGVPARKLEKPGKGGTR